MTGAAKQGSWAGQRILVLSPTPTHPQDFGNRKRIYQVCRQLQDCGAEISFVHYPAEAEWRHANPWSAERAMVEAWSQYFTVPPSRPLHTAPKGAYHEIDEWWDDSIGTFLRWLFSVQSFDLFIVNYAWLSKAFECAPPSIVKVLDTHDRKSGRREMLAANGIAPEYFYVTEDQERVALNRADIVWAIKDEERVLFERITAKPVLSLPHLDPPHALKRPEPDPDGYLRAGFLAARNSINHVNIVNFVKVAEPIFNAAFAPIKLVIAGSICDRLKDVEYSFVELRGRVANVDEFYESVDCAVIPMTFSTGLKIKTGEAISAGLPVVSTAHAFEGFQPADPLHTLADFPAMAQALVDLSFAPRSQLGELAVASGLTHAATGKLIAQTYERTLDLVRQKQRSLVLAVDSRAFVHGTIFNLVLRSVHRYLRHAGNLKVLVVKGSATHLMAGQQLMDELGRVLIARDVDDVERLGAELTARHVELIDVEDYLAGKQVNVLIADCLHPAFYSPSCADTAIFARTEMIALAEGTADFAVPGAAFRRAFVVAQRHSREAAASQAGASAAIVLAPCFTNSPTLTNALKPSGKFPRVVLLGSPQTSAMALALALADAWDMKPMVVCGIGDPSGGPSASPGASSATHYVEELIRGDTAAPLFAVDLSGGQSGLQICREILERLGVPVVTAESVGLHRSLGLSALPATVSTEFELSEVFRAFALNPDTRKDPMFDGTRVSLGTDRGWAYIWAFCKRLFETQDLEFA